jgi:sec-independent protein translocase protein TatB
VFGQFGWGEMLLLVVVGLFVFGPERLPTIARDAARTIKHFRDSARSMRDDLSAELGPELADLDLKSLNPRTLVEKHLLGDDDDDETTVAPPAEPVVPLSKANRTATAMPDATPYDDDAT